jgi:hypothetical protein
MGRSCASSVVEADDVRVGEIRDRFVKHPGRVEPAVGCVVFELEIEVIGLQWLQRRIALGDRDGAVDGHALTATAGDVVEARATVALVVALAQDEVVCQLVAEMNSGKPLRVFAAARNGHGGEHRTGQRGNHFFVRALEIVLLDAHTEDRRVATELERIHHVGGDGGFLGGIVREIAPVERRGLDLRPQTGAQGGERFLGLRELVARRAEHIARRGADDGGEGKRVRGSGIGGDLVTGVLLVIFGFAGAIFCTGFDRVGHALAGELLFPIEFGAVDFLFFRARHDDEIGRALARVVRCRWG